MNQMSNVDAAWAAGLVDGEGYITYQGNTPLVQVGMSHPSAVYKLAGLTGTKVHVRGPYDESRKVTYVWAITGDRAVAFLERIRPYLTVKGFEAWLTLEARANCPKVWGGHQRRGLTEEEAALRRGYVLALKGARGRQ